MASAAEIQIEKDVPLPSALVPHGRYPFAKLGVGDSFFVSAPHGSKEENSLRSAAYNHARNGRKFTVRRCDDGVRVWRVA